MILPCGEGNIMILPCGTIRGLYTGYKPVNTPQAGQSGDTV